MAETSVYGRKKPWRLDNVGYLCEPPGLPERAYHGFVDEELQCVLVQDRRDALDLYRGGFYGKGTLSKAIPEFVVKDECLQLGPEEALYLASRHRLGCLQLTTDSGYIMTPEDFFDKCCNWSSSFRAMIALYFYCRDSGWVPRYGLKFGADLVLYRQGPPFYHSAYAVKLAPSSDALSASWKQLHSLIRLSGHVAKHVLIAHVSASDATTLLTLLDSSHITLHLASRWRPESDRL